MRFIELKKNIKKDFSAFNKIKISILGDSSTQYLSQALRGYGYEAELDPPCVRIPVRSVI